VADELLRSGKTDLLLVRPWDETEERSGPESRFRRILVPLDGSEAAERVLVPAAELASRFQAAIVLIRVVPKPIELTSIYGIPGVELRGAGHRIRVQEATEYLDAVTQRLSGARVESHVLEGSGAGDGIVEGARSLDADLVVLSSRGHGEMARLVMGSVADKVVRGTTRPVLVVHRSAEPGTP
jgi:nucleotide-binding universal stress UspA family protein